MLLDAGAHPNVPGADEVRSALLCATSVGHVGVVKALLLRHAKVDARDLAGATPLMIAAGLGSSLVVDALMHAGANVYTVDSTGATCLHHAVRGAPGHAAIVRALVKYGADPAAVTSGGQSVLDLAHHTGDGEVVSALEAALATHPSRK